MSPLGPRTGSPPDQPQAASQPPQSAAQPPAQGQPQQQGAPGGNGPSPMAALMSVADNLPPGSPRSAGGSPPGSSNPRSASRASLHSPNSTGTRAALRRADRSVRVWAATEAVDWELHVACSLLTAHLPLISSGHGHGKAGFIYRYLLSFHRPHIRTKSQTNLWNCDPQ